MSRNISRRDFMHQSVLTTAGLGLAISGTKAARGAAPASDKVRVGVIGTGRMGRGNLEDFAKQPDVEISVVCDVFAPNLDEGVKTSNGKAATCKDFRQILDRKDIDAVIVATPDHWHALMAVEACKAGKDVYVEKPISTTVEEGRHMVQAARKYNRVVQVGTQQRSGIHFQKAVAAVQQGMIGKVSFVRTWNYDNNYPEGIGNPPDSAPPSDLDWEMWLGPAPKAAFNTNRFGVGDRWSTFRYFWDYAGGFMTDWGVHLMDIVQWAMQEDGPTAVSACGGKFYLQDNAETPDTLQVTYEYPHFICTYENRWDNGNSMYGKNYGIEFHGTDGTLFVDRSGFKLTPETIERHGKRADRTAAMEMPSVNDEHFDHVRNFLDCVKSRQRPISDIEIGHRSTSVCLLGNVALRSQQRIAWEAASELLTAGDARAKQLLGREYRPPWKLTV